MRFALHKTMPGLIRPLEKFLSNDRGFFFSPLAASVFIGLMLIVSVFSVMESYLLLGKIGTWGYAGIFTGILVIVFGLYKGLARLKGRRFKQGSSDPLYLRSLMADCFEKVCAPLEKRLENPSLSSSDILNDILLDKALEIFESDCMRFTDIRRQFEKSRLKLPDHVNFRDFFTPEKTYDERPLTGEIQQVADAVSRRNSDLSEAFAHLKKAHRELFTSLGDYLNIFSPPQVQVEKLIKSHRYNPPAPDEAQRIIFAVNTLAYLKSVRFENVKKDQARLYETFADQFIPKLAGYIKAYKRQWERTVRAYEEA